MESALRYDLHYDMLVAHANNTDIHTIFTISLHLRLAYLQMGQFINAMQ